MGPFNQVVSQWFLVVVLALELLGHLYYDFHERPARKPRRWAGFLGTCIGFPVRVLFFLSAGAFTEIFK